MASFSPLFDVGYVRRLFPILDQNVYGNKPLVYFDNAATTHKPFAVTARGQQFYAQDNANIHRGMHALAVRSTEALEQTRSAVQGLIGAPNAENIVFTSGTTQSINLVAATYGEMVVRAGDEVVISELEHHSNIAPWQRLCKQKGAILKVIPMSDQGELELSDADRLITRRTKIVALTYVSNTLGTVIPIKSFVEKAHAKGAVVVVDGAQAVPHLAVDVIDLDCDFFAFSAHKAYGLTGLGFLYGKKEWMELMPPYQLGGGMVDEVTLERSTYLQPPYKFEAGTLPLASIASFSEAVRFFKDIGFAWRSYEQELLTYALEGLYSIPAVRLVGNPSDRVGIISFNLGEMHPLDVGLLLDAQGIAARTGHCCTQPIMHRLGVEGVVRISFAVYNTKEEIDLFLAALRQIARKGY